MKRKQPKFRVGQYVVLLGREVAVKVVALIPDGVRVNWDGICFPCNLTRVRPLTRAEKG